jgi:pimeloyl-ACP methyl ester carboxylesterase
LNLLSLGDAARRLFAIHDPAVATGRRARALVVCNPLGAEYDYAHRSLRKLALRLARRGIHVVRFDYYGTGDSYGEDEEADPGRMHEDAELAIEAARDISGADRVALLGLRFGATVALRAASRHAGLVESLVLWDPTEQPEVPLALRQRTLMMATADRPSWPGVERIMAPCCWDESITVSGALPLPAYRRIEEWLDDARVS